MAVEVRDESLPQCTPKAAGTEKEACVNGLYAEIELWFEKWGYRARPAVSTRVNKITPMLDTDWSLDEALSNLQPRKAVRSLCAGLTRKWSLGKPFSPLALGNRYYGAQVFLEKE